MEHTSTETPSLLPPLVLDQGSIVTVKMRGHSRTNGLDYFALAIVLSQAPIRQDNQGGELEIFVLDPTAGSHYSSNYPVRDISSRPSKDGGVELYELSSNVGEILFMPVVFEQIRTIGHAHQAQISQLQEENTAMQNFLMDVANQLSALQAQVNSLTAAQGVSKAAGDPAGVPATPSDAQSPRSGGKQK